MALIFFCWDSGSLRDLSGAVNCVVVKDLSRLGRNYIETGKVLQEFADHGVRFIAINDGYDTANAQGQASTILLPIKNLMNDSYSRDISVKIRSHLEVKKERGSLWGRLPPTAI
ncbi:MAG: recombinase family protein [Dysosmobacter sp.]